MTTETEETKSVTVSGALATSVDWDEDLSDETSDLYTSTAESAKSDLENLLTSSDDVQSATVTITGFEEATSSRKRRQATSSKATVKYSAECTVPESKSTGDISSSVESAVQNADPTEFNSFDSSSFADFSVDVEETNEETTTEPATQEPDETTVADTTTHQSTIVQTDGTTTNAQTTKATEAAITTAEQSTVAETTKGLEAATSTVQPTDGRTTITESATRPTTEEPPVQTTTVESPKNTTPDVPSETTTNKQAASTTRPSQPTEPASTAGNSAVTTAQEVSADEAAALGELGDLSDSLGAL